MGALECLPLVVLYDGSCGEGGVKLISAGMSNDKFVSGHADSLCK